MSKKTSFFVEHRKVMNSRKNLVKKVCQKYKITRSLHPIMKVVNRRIVCLNPQKICYCPISKTGSTTWMHEILVKHIFKILQ